MNIQDIFRVGDYVEWVTVRRSGRVVDIRKQSGVINEIVGSDAMIEIVDRTSRKRVSLHKLKVVRQAETTVPPEAS